jgi:hypothetical protein
MSMGCRCKGSQCKKERWDRISRYHSCSRSIVSDIDYSTGGGVAET